MKTPVADKTYSINELAELFKVSTRTLQREISRGNLKASKVGRKYTVSQEALDKYLNKDTSHLSQKIKKFCNKQKT